MEKKVRMWMIVLTALTLFNLIVLGALFYTVKCNWDNDRYWMGVETRYQEDNNAVIDSIEVKINRIEKE